MWKKIAAIPGLFARFLTWAKEKFKSVMNWMGAGAKHAFRVLSQGAGSSADLERAVVAQPQQDVRQLETERLQVRDVSD